MAESTVEQPAADTAEAQHTASIAPIKASVLPLSNNQEFTPIVKVIT